MCNIIIFILRPCLLNSDLKYFNLSVIHLEVTYIPKIVILAYFLTSYRQKKKTEAESIAPSVSPTLTAGAKKILRVQAVRGFSVHFWKKLPFFAQMISNMYSLDPDIAQSIQTRLTPD